MLMRKFLVLLMAAVAAAGAVYGGGYQDPPSPTPTPSPIPTITSTAMASTMGAVDVSSIPPGAIVYYYSNGGRVNAGTAPLVLRLEPGNYQLNAYLAGYGEYSQVVAVRAGETVNVVAVLEKMRPSPTPNPSPTPPTTPGEDACDFSTMEERIRCRINLPETAEGGQLPFVPEECRVLEGVERGKCISLYAQLNICNQEKTDAQRDICARGELSLGDVRFQKEQCEGRQEGNERLDCIAELRQKTYSLIKFRFYNLEEKAEKLGELGVQEGTVVRFIAELELKKQDFNEAGGLERRKQVLWEVKKLWFDFRKEAVAQLNALQAEN